MKSKITDYFLGYSSQDPSTWSLLASNLFVIVLAVFQGWSVMTVMLIYWIQSMIIGFFTFVRMLTLKEFTTEGMKRDNKPLKPTTANKIFLALFFAFHYGFFHFGYLAFIVAFSTIGLGTLISGGELLIIAVIFFVNHMFSFLYNRERDLKRKPHLGRIMFFPYLRIVPMHFTIMVGFLAGATGALVIFLLLKTVADVAMHVVEHERIKLPKHKFK
jgi:hypothetical protein